MRLHVTGATGYLGRELVALAPDASTERVEVRDARATEAVLSRLRPEVVIHTAYRQGGEDAYATTATGAGNVARACAAVGARLVHLSTDVVFDGRAGRPYREDDPIYGACMPSHARAPVGPHPSCRRSLPTPRLVAGGARAPQRPPPCERSGSRVRVVQAPRRPPVAPHPASSRWAGPNGITAGPDGNLWFTELWGNRIGRITPQGVVTEFSAGISAKSGLGGITAGPDGNLWFTEYDGNRIGRITPTGQVTEFRTGISPSSAPSGITAGPDGNLWFTEEVGNRIGRITPAGVVTEFSVGITQGSTPTGITAGPDGNLWFTEGDGNRVGRITPGGAVTEFSTGISGGGRSGITAGPDGNLWFTEPDAGRIGRTTPTGQVTRIPVWHQRALQDHRRSRRQPVVHRVRRKPDRPHHPGGRGDPVLGGNEREQLPVRHRRRP